MSPKEYLHWLEKNNLIDIARSNSIHFKKVYKECLKVKREQILIIGDKGYEGRPDG